MLIGMLSKILKTNKESLGPLFASHPLTSLKAAQQINKASD